MLCVKLAKAAGVVDRRGVMLIPISHAEVDPCLVL